jgi:aminoglycoside N3'-acetyltransferase
MLTYNDYVNALKKAGIKKGDIVHIQSDIGVIGSVEFGDGYENKTKFYIDGLLECIGEDGTISVPTFFYDYSRYGVPFDVQTSPSQTGAISEKIRTTPDAIRSKHPVVSICAIGAKAKELIGENHFSSYGADSPWARLHKLNAKIVSLGLGWRMAGGTSFVHYCESMFAVPYQYNKLLSIPVYNNGNEVGGVFTHTVRYIDFDIAYDTSDFKRRMVEDGLAKCEKLGDGEIFCCESSVFFDKAIEELNNNRYSFLVHKPTFRNGEMPMDGTTGDMVVKHNQEYNKFYCKVNMWFLNGRKYLHSTTLFNGLSDLISDKKNIEFTFGKMIKSDNILVDKYTDQEPSRGHSYSAVIKYDGGALGIYPDHRSDKIKDEKYDESLIRACVLKVGDLYYSEDETDFTIIQKLIPLHKSVLEENVAINKLSEEKGQWLFTKMTLDKLPESYDKLALKFNSIKGNKRTVYSDIYINGDYCGQIFFCWSNKNDEVINA